MNDKLPAHLQDKSLESIADYMVYAINRKDWSAVASVQAAEVTTITPHPDGNFENQLVGTYSRDEFIELLSAGWKDCDPEKGEIWATDSEGKLRMDVEVLVPGKLVRIVQMPGSEAKR